MEEQATWCPSEIPLPSPAASSSCCRMARSAGEWVRPDGAGSRSGSASIITAWAWRACSERYWTGTVMDTETDDPGYRTETSQDLSRRPRLLHGDAPRG